MKSITAYPMWAAVLALLACGVTDRTFAAEGQVITVYTGFRDGGSFDDEVSGSSVSINSSESFAASLDLPLDGARQFQIFYSYQKSELEVAAMVAGLLPVSTELPLRVSYLQLGGTNYFSEEVGQGAYVVGGLGATLFDPSGDDYEEELRFSLNLGLGYNLPLGERFALRFEARGYFTFINSSGSMFCANGRCAISVSADSAFQGELNVGLAFGL